MAKPIFFAAGALALAIAVPAIVIGQQTARYLPPDSVDMSKVLPPAPIAGDARARADRRIFKDTRHWLGTPRGDLATRDVNTSPSYMASAFSCALGITLTPENAPKTIALITRAGAVANAQSQASKDFFKRLRPFQIDHGKTCQPPEQLKGSYDYPSGHSTWGWTWALLLADLAPDRASAILTRGRAYGESRVVCGVHNYSAIEAGRITASGTLAAEGTAPAFMADLAAARSEIDALRANTSVSKPAKCESEASVVGTPIL